jgi:peroxiredoxin
MITHHHFHSSPRHFSMTRSVRTALSLAAAAALIALPPARAQAPKVVYTPAENAIVQQLRGLRDVPDQQRGARTTDIALQIRSLPTGPNKIRLAGGLANLSTEGDFGHDSLQAVATTLTATLIESPVPGKNGEPASPYLELARLVRYEHVTTDLKDPQYDQALTILQQNESEVEKADFTLTDLSGKSWTLSGLRGKVVLVNFWATWCPPCRKEMPDLNALAHRFAKQGLVVLSLSDEDSAKVSAYVSSHDLKYPILLDPGGTTAKSFHVDGIPKSFIFGRTGKLVTESIDMRTQGQFLQMLALADIR